MGLDPQMLDTNWPLIYVDGKVRAGQPEGEGWNVTRAVVGFMDVYHQGEVAPEILVEAIHHEIRAWSGAASEDLLAVGLPNRLNYTFTSPGFKVGGQPDDPAFTVTAVMPTFALWHAPDVPLDTLTLVLRWNIQFVFAMQALNAGE